MKDSKVKKKKDPPEVKPIKFINKQSLKAFEELPVDIRHAFTHQLESLIAYGLHPTIPTDTLPGKVVELKVNGSPAHRCVYQVTDEAIIVVHSFPKTAQGRDKKNLKTIEARLKALDETQFC